MQKRNAGCAILLVSADLDELLRLSDRLLTIYEGRITGEFQAGDIDKREIGYYMTGGRKEETSMNKSKSRLQYLVFPDA